MCCELERNCVGEEVKADIFIRESCCWRLERKRVSDSTWRLIAGQKDDCSENKIYCVCLFCNLFACVMNVLWLECDVRYEAML